MEEDKKKKKKLTISISSKRSSNFVNINRGNKKSVIIEKKVSRPGRGEKIFFDRRGDQNKPRPKFGDRPQYDKNKAFSKGASTNRSQEIRRIAEEKATRRFKDSKDQNFQPKKSGLTKNKNFTARRESKLTISRALDDEALDGKERSLASVRRARLKEKKSQDESGKKVETKKIVHEVNIPDKITIQNLFMTFLLTMVEEWVLILDPPLMI